MLAGADIALAASRSPRKGRWRSTTKPLLMPALGTAFSASLVSRDVNHGGLLRGGTVAAQALSGVGDIALLGTTRPAFLAGLASFLGAHVAYTAAFASTRRSDVPTVGGPAHDRGSSRGHLREWGGVGGAACLFAALGPPISARAGRHSPALRAPVLAYTGAVTTMFAAATRLHPDLPAGARRRIVTGSALLLGSDTILAVREFVLPVPPPWTGAAVMATYTLGQGLIAAGVSEAVRNLPDEVAPSA